MNWKFGVRYHNGKVFFFTTNEQGQFKKNTNPGIPVPDWAIDIREIIAMIFVGIAALCLIFKDDVNEAMYLLIALTGYAIGRTVPQMRRPKNIRKRKPFKE